MKVRDLIEQDICVDVYDDVCEALAIAMDGPIRLTKAGKKKFEDVLDYEVKLADGCAIVSVDGPDGVWQKKLRNAQQLFEGAAGYCTVEDYDKWFVV